MNRALRSIALLGLASRLAAIAGGIYGCLGRPCAEALQPLELCVNRAKAAGHGRGLTRVGS